MKRNELPKYTIRTGQLNGAGVAVVMRDGRVYCHTAKVVEAKRIIAALVMYDGMVGPNG